MTKVDWFSAIEKGMAQAEKTNPCLKMVGTGGDVGDFYGNENNIKLSQTEGPIPTTQILVGTGGDDMEAVPTVPTAEILVGTDDEARQSLKKQAITPYVPTVPNYTHGTWTPGAPDRLRYTCAWDGLLSQCPAGVNPFIWETAIYDAADLFGFWGTEFDRLRWPAGSLFRCSRRARLVSQRPARVLAAASERLASWVSSPGPRRETRKFTFRPITARRGGKTGSRHGSIVLPSCGSGVRAAQGPS
jgi:hypothetical protein